MRGYTEYARAAARQLSERGGWVQGSQVAQAMGVPLANLKSAFARLVLDDLVVMDGVSHPRRYRINPNLGEAQRETLRRLTEPSETEA